MRTQEHGLFVQDDMKLGNRLTVNAGLRYEIFTAPTEEENRLVNFDPANLHVDLRRREWRERDGEPEDAQEQLRAAPRPHVPDHR